MHLTCEKRLLHKRKEKKMVRIIIGTTPTIHYAFQIVDPADFTAAFLTIKDAEGTEVLRKGLDDAVTGEGSIEWKLSQAETLGLTPGGKYSMMLNWVLEDGTRGASYADLLLCDDNHIREVIV